MCVCYLHCHEAGLCCYLVRHTANLLRPLQLLYFHLCPIYWLYLVVNTEIKTLKKEQDYFLRLIIFFVRRYRSLIIYRVSSRCDTKKQICIVFHHDTIEAWYVESLSNEADRDGETVRWTISRQMDQETLLSPLSVLLIVELCIIYGNTLWLWL
jgi:hypothetical protein